MWYIPCRTNGTSTWPWYTKGKVDKKIHQHSNLSSGWEMLCNVRIKRTPILSGAASHSCTLSFRKCLTEFRKLVGTQHKTADMVLKTLRFAIQLLRPKKHCIHDSSFSPRHEHWGPEKIKRCVIRSSLPKTVHDDNQNMRNCSPSENLSHIAEASRG
jgi:hypothetical protein